jgi:hypothetical protein
VAFTSGAGSAYLSDVGSTSAEKGGEGEHEDLANPNYTETLVPQGRSREIAAVSNPVNQKMIRVTRPAAAQ